MKKERMCLKCQKIFLSMGVGNRICDRCSKTTRSSVAPPVSKAVRANFIELARKKDGPRERAYTTPTARREHAKARKDYRERERLLPNASRLDPYGKSQWLE